MKSFAILMKMHFNFLDIQSFLIKHLNLSFDIFKMGNILKETFATLMKCQEVVS